MTYFAIIALLLAAHYRRRYIREAARNRDLRSRTDTLIQERYRVTRRDRKTAAKLWRLRRELAMNAVAMEVATVAVESMNRRETVLIGVSNN